MSLRVAVVDDEPLAREGLAEQLAQFPDVELAGIYPDAVAALSGLDTAPVDVLFADIRMPGMSGLELAAALDAAAPPHVVFVTAHDEHAVRAFELHALDYLLKPASRERIAQALDRARRAPRAPRDAFRRRLEALLDELEPGRGRGAARLIVREVGQIVVVVTKDVDWIEGSDYYARLHVGPRVHLLRETLAALEQRLDPRRFMRVHRSAIVNLDRVRKVEAAERGAGTAVLADGARVRVTADRRAELERRLEALEP